MYATSRSHLIMEVRMNHKTCNITLVSYKNNVRETIIIEAPSSMSMDDLNFLIKKEFPSHNIVAIDRTVSVEQ